MYFNDPKKNTGTFLGVVVADIQCEEGTNY